MLNKVSINHKLSSTTGAKISGGDSKIAAVRAPLRSSIGAKTVSMSRGSAVKTQAVLTLDPEVGSGNYKARSKLDQLLKDST